MKLLRDAWGGLDNSGRIILIVCGACLLGLALWLGVDLSWVPALLAGG